VVDGINANLDRVAWRLELRADASGGSHIVWIDTAANGTVTELDKEPDVSALRRTGIWFLGLLPIESQL
jgi:putative cardiolipin synthase